MQKWIQITPHTYLLLVSEQNKKKEKLATCLLYHFCRWRDCTERVQQAVKPLDFP